MAAATMSAIVQPRRELPKYSTGMRRRIPRRGADREVLDREMLREAGPYLVTDGGGAPDHEATVARVAVVAAPIRVDGLAEVLQDVARAALSALTIVDHRAELRAVEQAPLLVVGE